MKPSLLAVAISGGIDSLVAAYLLKGQGHNIIGIHFTTGYETQPVDNENNVHFANVNESVSHTMEVQALDTIFHISNQLGIEVKHLDCSTQFKNQVIDYFINTYQTGQTPNPCMVCNPLIKFGTVFDFARKLGASSIATGHYARVSTDKEGRFHLFKDL